MTPFDYVAQELERRTSLSRLEARGTLRIALKEGGFDASAGAREVEVVLRKVLPRELAARAIDGSAALCDALAGAVASQTFDAAKDESPEQVFGRLAGR